MDVLASLVSPRSGARQVRVLIVEDDPGSRWVLCALLKRFGFECRAVEDGLKALEAARIFAPHVILMDLMLPILDGLEAIRRLKADAETRGILVLVLTANATTTGEREARQAGCDGFMAKPVVLDALIRWLWDRVLF